MSPYSNNEDSASDHYVDLDELRENYLMECIHAVRKILNDPDVNLRDPEFPRDQFYSMVAGEFTRITHGMTARGIWVAGVGLHFGELMGEDIPDLPRKS